jgi:hypothetical protein
VTAVKREVAVKGFTEADCEQINANDVCAVVKCKGQTDITTVTGKLVKLRFAMRDADLYAYQFRPIR